VPASAAAIALPCSSRRREMSCCDMACPPEVRLLAAVEFWVG
jgi:hypothetical protein